MVDYHFDFETMTLEFSLLYLIKKNQEYPLLVMIFNTNLHTANVCYCALYRSEDAVVSFVWALNLITS